MHDLKRVRVEPRQRDQAFTHFTWDKPAIEVLYAGEGINQPWDYMPIQIADAFAHEYREFGGVVIFEGTLEDYPDPMRSKHLKPLIDEAIRKMIEWERRKVEEASGEWNTPNHQGAKNIVEVHRSCAYDLFDRRLLPKLPEWISVSREQADLVEPCPVCKVEPKLGAAICTTNGCNWVLDPASAYTLGVITEEHPALERLTREQVEELGVSAFVAETVDEREARVRKGHPKPLSKVALAQQRAAQKEAQQAEQPAKPAEQK